MGHNMGAMKMPRNRDDILKILEANREEIRGYGVQRIGLFGSCARGESTATSDLDFVVDFEKKSFDAYMGLKEFLEDLFGCRVDLVISDAIKPRLRRAILEETVRAQCAGIDWKRITGLRNILIHEYFGVDLPIIWDIVQNKLAELEEKIPPLLEIGRAH